MKKLTVLIDKDKDGLYRAKIPALKNCYTQAKTISELSTKIKKAIQANLKHGKKVCPWPIKK